MLRKEATHTTRARIMHVREASYNARIVCKACLVFSNSICNRLGHALFILSKRHLVEDSSDHSPKGSVAPGNTCPIQFLAISGYILC